MRRRGVGRGRGRRQRGGGGGENSSHHTFLLEFGGIRGLSETEVVRIEALAWSWGMSSSGPRGGGGGWGEPEEPAEAEEEETYTANIQDISVTTYMERSLIRGPMNAIARGKPFAWCRLVGMITEVVAKPSKKKKDAAAPSDKPPTDQEKAAEEEDEDEDEEPQVRHVPYFFINSEGGGYVSSCSMGGSGGEDRLTTNISLSSLGGGWTFHYLNAEGRDADANHFDPWAASLLGCSVYCNGTRRRGGGEPAPATAEKPPALIEFGQALWGPKAHHFWPAEFRTQVRTLLLCRNRVGGAFRALPKDVLFQIIGTLSRNHVPEVQRFLNPNPFDTLHI